MRDRYEGFLCMLEMKQSKNYPFHRTIFLLIIILYIPLSLPIGYSFLYNVLSLSSHGREEAQARVAYSSRCIYVGNLAFVTTDVQLYTLFSQCGSIERVIMGINRHTKQPIGFAYVM
jgi:hypothetical protein